MPKAHMEVRKGTPQQASEYCKKDLKFFEQGEISKQGKRSDIERGVELIKDGNTMKDIARLEPILFVKFNKGFKALKTALIEPRNEVPYVEVFHGTTGTGKSHSAREVMDATDENYYIWTPARGKWFDGYDGEKMLFLKNLRDNCRIECY